MTDAASCVGLVAISLHDQPQRGIADRPAISMPSRRRALLAFAALTVGLCECEPLVAQDVAPPPENAGPIVATPTSIVDDILTLAGVGPDDFVVDLGSGDGRIVIAAVARYGARGGFGVSSNASADPLALSANTR